jgi:demethoxyubiquinone hydroxylase (CLK1/Coq7/Cat5 family)
MHVCRLLKRHSRYCLLLALYYGIEYMLYVVSVSISKSCSILLLSVAVIVS